MMKSRLKIILLLCYFSFYCGLWSGEPEEQAVSFHFNNVPLRTALQQLSDKYNFNFIFDDALIDDIVVTNKVVNESPYTAIKKLLLPCHSSCEFLTQNTIVIHRLKEKVKPYRLLEGNVRDAESGLPLAYANVYIQGKNVGSATDLNGNFSFEIPDSSWRLIVSYIGYVTEILPITPQSNMLDISLHPQPFESNSIIITAPRILEEVEQISISQLNEEYFIGVVPEISSEMKYASFMHYNNNEVYFYHGDISNENFYINFRGKRLHPMIGTDRNNRLAFKQHHVSLNGFSLQMPYHTTVIPAMNPCIVNYDLIQNYNYHTSTFDVEYADAYESVMDLHYRRGNPNTISGKAMIDLSNSAFMLEGPLTSKASWIISGKKSYINNLLNSVYKSKWMSYSYYDFQAQLDFQPVEQHNIRLNYINSTDQTSFNPKINYIRERMMYNYNWEIFNILAEEHIQETNFDNNRLNLNSISVSDIYLISNKWKGEFTVTHAQQQYHNNWSWLTEHEMRLPDVTDKTYNYLWSQGKDSYFRIKSWEEKFILHYNVSQVYTMKAGIHFEQLQYNARIKNTLLTRSGVNISEPPDDNRILNDMKIIKTYSCFYQEERRLFDKLQIQTGVRYDHFNLQQKGHLNPRIVINYDLPREIRTRVAFGTFSQLPEFGEMQQYMLERFEPDYKPGDLKIEFHYTYKYMVGFEKSFASYARLEVNYFYKDMRNLIPIQRLSDGSLLYDVKKKARASSRGFDVNAKLNFNMLSLTCRYKYMDSFENSVDRQNYNYYIDQPHSLEMSLNVVLPHDWYIGLQAIYGSGFAYTPCVLVEVDRELCYNTTSTTMWEYHTDSPNSAWYPGYSRLDMVFRKGFILPFGKITTYVKLINLLNTSPTFSYIYTYDQNGNPIRQSESLIPFFPQVGFEYQF